MRVARASGLLASVLGTTAIISVVVLHAQISARSNRVELYNKWGINDGNNEHWGGVGSENYGTAKWDNTGYNEGYHPRDSSSADGESMEPAWTRMGPRGNSEHTGPGTEGDVFNPPDVQIFKPFSMKGRKQTLYDVDGPQPSDGNPAQWAAAGRGSAAWMEDNEGPLLASQQVLPEGQKLVKGGRFDGGALPAAIVHPHRANAARPQRAHAARRAHAVHRAQKALAPRRAKSTTAPEAEPHAEEGAAGAEEAAPVAAKQASAAAAQEVLPRKLPWNSDFSQNSNMGTNEVFLGAPQGGYVKKPTTAKKTKKPTAAKQTN